MSFFNHSFFWVLSVLRVLEEICSLPRPIRGTRYTLNLCSFNKLKQHKLFGSGSIVEMINKLISDGEKQ